MASVGDVHFLEQALVIGVPGQSAVFLLEDEGVVALHGISLDVVFPVPLHGIDEEQAQDLDPLRGQPTFLVQVLLDGALNHLALDGQGFHVTRGLPRSKESWLQSGSPQFHELASLGDADFADPTVMVHRSLRRHLQEIAILNVHLLSLHPATDIHIQLHLGRNDPAFGAD